MQIQLLQLAMLAKKLVEDYEARGYGTVPIDDMDMYWVVQPPEWTDLHHEPKLSTGSLKEDWEALQRVLDGQMPTAVDFDRLAAVLRAVSERLAR
ncbi:hypothetical protein SAMN05444354_105259 [Stigmatella aurantiaca]|uniref:Uncharacterized protein n=1 Tax=Stigmatella aurantiaca TaxID=41 RepID=A0A1H7PE31_STIAU|nr:hypothetical protein [Stigmatella aurantiaca]SEL33896.1 hypothetical protein SAMN05444354_105259 [Stigmatella aurantiaca]